MKAMIFAAGLGTRLRPITDTLPKALVPVCGKPLLEHVIRKLRASGIEEAVVNVHHFADSIEAWLEEQDWISLYPEYASEDRFSVYISDERQCLLETGGAVLNARRYLDGCGKFLIHNVDIISDLDIRWFESSFVEGALASLLVSERKTSRYLLFDRESMRLVGWTDTSSGEVRSPYPDLDADNCRMLAFSGIHIMSDTIFDVMADFVRERGIDMEMPRFPIMDFYLSVCAEYEIYGVIADDLHLTDVGKPDALEMAEKELMKYIK